MNRTMIMDNIDNEKKHQMLNADLKRFSLTNQGLNESIRHIIDVKGILVALSTGIGIFFINLLKDKLSTPEMAWLSFLLFLCISCFLLSLILDVRILTRYSAFRMKNDEVDIRGNPPRGNIYFSLDIRIKQFLQNIGIMQNIISSKQKNIKTNKKLLYAATILLLIYIALSLFYVLCYIH